MKNNKLYIHSITANNYTVRVEQYEGRKHLVIPVIMLVDGVHNGSQGPLLHLSDEFGKIPESWNGIPVSIQHPEQDGTPVSANSPSIIEQQTVGRIFNTRLDGDKLKAEAWIDEEKVRNISPETLQLIRYSKPIEVSTGVFTDDDLSDGDWHNENYVGIARNHRPDHLALLPNDIGACSNRDGCGVRTNKEEDNNMKNEEIKKIKAAILAINLLNNELSYGEVIRKIQNKLDAMDDDIKVHYLEPDGVFDDNFIYRVSPRGLGESLLFQRNYEVNTDETIEFTGEPVAVIKRTEFIQTSKKGVSVMSNKNKKTKEECPECENKINLLIECKETKFKEEDREQLNTLSEDMLDKLFPEQKPEKKEDKEKEIQMNKEKAVEVLKEDLGDKDRFLKLLPPEVQAQFQHGMKLHEAERTKLISHITQNSEGVYEEEDIKSMSTSDLEKLAMVIKAPANYTGMGAGSNVNVNNSNEEDILPPAGVTLQ
jgi:hypothetical protein